MSKHETGEPTPPNDLERLQVLARLIKQRLDTLYTAQRSPSFTPAESRELVVLEALRDDWLLEARE